MPLGGNENRESKIKIGCSANWIQRSLLPRQMEPAVANSDQLPATAPRRFEVEGSGLGAEATQYVDQPEGTAGYFSPIRHSSSLKYNVA
jgi:hypothetical protein